jgi:hypothetical protein
VVLLVMSLVMGLKIRWFRAQMDMKGTNKRSELRSLDGVYRSQPFEASTSAPLAPQSYNTIAGSSSHKSPISPSSEKLSTHSSLLRGSKTGFWKKPTASSLEGPPEGPSQPSKHNRKIDEGAKTKSNSASGKNPLSKQKKHNKAPQNSIQLSSPQNPPLFAAMGQPQLSQNEGENVDGNRLRAQSVPNKNPLARPDIQNKLVEGSLGQSTKPKAILQKVKPPTLPTTYDDSSNSHTLNDGNSTSLRPTERSSSSLIQKTPLPLYVLEQDESESLS